MNSKLITLILVFTFLTSCKLPWQKEPRSGGSYGNVVRAISPGPNGNFDRAGDFSRTLNDLMSGPTNGMNCNGTPSGNEMITFKMGPTKHYETITNKFGDKEEIVKWNECGGDMTASFTYNSRGAHKPISCTKRKINKEFYNFFEKNFSKCTIEAFENVKGKSLANSVEKITFLHEGIEGDKRHRRKGKSLHNMMRAIDIPLFAVHSEGKKYSFNAINQKVQPEKNFFDSFRSCWAKQVVAYNPDCAKDRDNLHGSRGHEDGVHTQHLHISLPYCKGDPGDEYWRKVAEHDSHEGHNH